MNILGILMGMVCLVGALLVAMFLDTVSLDIRALISFGFIMAGCISLAIGGVKK